VFWLSHHHADEHHRTYVLGGVRICARCLGVYPVMLAGIAAQVAVGASTPWRHDPPWAIGLLIPALVDWARGRFRPHAGSNGLRTATGVLLGLALARTLYIHLREPLPPLLLAQAALVTAVAVPVMVLTWRRGTG
jgi:uncharacterized membrane protein